MKCLFLAVATTIGLISLGAPRAVEAKASISKLLCFEPNDLSISSAIDGELAKLVEASKGIGDVVGLFVVTEDAANLEPEQVGTARVQSLLEDLRRHHGFRSPLYHTVRLSSAPSQSLGCAERQVVVTLEVLFPHDGYR